MLQGMLTETARKGEQRMSQLRVMATAALAFVLLYGIVYWTGGTNTAYPHLMYLPVIFSSFLGTWTTALGSALLAGLLMSQWLMPLSVVDGTMQPWNSWVLRLVIFAAAAAWTRFLAQNLERRQAEELRRSQEVQHIQFASLAALVDLAETRDPETTGTHMRRMQSYAQLLLERMALPSLTKDDRWRIASAVAFHDIGKVAIPDGILLKKGELDEEEWDVMRSHPGVGAQVIERVQRQVVRSQQSNDDSMIRYLATAREIVLYHHERIDGSGYPQGLHGDTIPISAQVTAICDVYDALRSERPYKRAYSHLEAVEYILSQRGHQFSLLMVDSFLQASAGFERIFDEFTDGEQ